MGADYYSGVILGVKVTDLGLKIEKISTPYEIHDKKGIPTGKLGSDVSYKVTFKDKEKVVEHIYLEYIEQILAKYLTKPLQLLHESCGDRFDIDDVIIGVKLVKKGYDDWNMIKEIPMNSYSTIKNAIKNQFDSNVDPKMYFYFNVSC
jgi:hypothetical protein